MKRHCARNTVAPQLILGLAVMFLGLLLVLDNFGLLQARQLVRMWPLLLVGAGVMRLYYSIRSQGPLAGYVLIGLGVGQLLVNYGVVSFRQALAVFLLATGAVTAARAIRRSGEATGRSNDAIEAFGGMIQQAADDIQRSAGAIQGAGEPQAMEARHLDLFAFMSYISRAVGHSDFRGGHASAFMGACEIDLRGARIESGQVVVNIFAFWGGIEIKVPKDWEVESRGLAVLGAFEDNSRRPDDARQKLIVSGMVIMGGVEVKN